MSAPHILIVGGGIGGLAFAHGLKKHNISFHVYERDKSDDYRTQGYRLRIAGQAIDALKYLLDDETWRLYELTCGETRIRPIPEIDATTGRVDIAEAGQGAGMGGGPIPYTVDRTVFRDVLLRDLSEHVTYGKSLQNYEITDNGITARFADGTTANGTLLVGADGARSAVRQQYLPDYPLSDTGGRCVYGKTPLTPQVLEVLEPAMLNGMGAIKDRSRDRLIAVVIEAVTFPHREGMEREGFDCPQDYIYWVMVTQNKVLGLPDDAVPHLTVEQSEATALKISENWHPSVRPLVTQQARSQTAVLPIYSCPPDLPAWEPDERVTLIGDAVHLTVPAGSGAVYALQDAHCLCQQLVEGGQSKKSIGQYESQMRDYAKGFIETSLQMGEMIFGQRSGEERNIGEMMMALRRRRQEARSTK